MNLINTHMKLQVPSDHNWLIYGPILVCICLITLCMMYEKIYLCYLSSKVCFLVFIFDFFGNALA